MRLNMAPGLLGFHGTDNVRAYPVERRNIFAQHARLNQRSDFAHFGISQFGSVMVLAPSNRFWMNRQSVSLALCGLSLANHVGHVIGRRAEPEMRGPDTIATISIRTVVKHRQPVLNEAVGLFIGKAVSVNLTIIVAKLAIAMGVKRAGPQPTITRHVYLRPESLGSRYRGTMTAHLVLQDVGATPGAVHSSVPASSCPDYTRKAA